MVEDGITDSGVETLGGWTMGSVLGLGSSTDILVPRDLFVGSSMKNQMCKVVGIEIIVHTLSADAEPFLISLDWPGRVPPLDNGRPSPRDWLWFRRRFRRVHGSPIPTGARG